MFTAEPLPPFDHPDLEPYRTMKRSEEHRARGIFVAEGEKVVRRLLESPFTVISVLAPERWIQEYGPLLARRAEPVRAYIAPKDRLQDLTGFSMYQGVLALGRIPEPATLDSILTGAQAPYLLAAIEGLSNAENVGVVIRNAAALGVQALLVGETCCSAFLRRSIRSSMGAIFKLPVVEVANLKQSLCELRRLGIAGVAAHPHEGRTPAGIDLTRSVCLVFGSEGYGLSEDVLAACEACAAIPMAGGIDSLNVASASAIFFYEAWRQRQG